MKKKSLCDMDRDTLSKLLHLCVPAEGGETVSDPDRQRSEGLEDLLAESLPKVGSTESVLSGHLDSICELSGLDQSVCLREYLLQSTTDLNILKRIQQRGKAILRRNESPLDQELGGALYYAAIASARVFHHETISNLPFIQMHEAFTALIACTWIPTDLKNLFEQAIKPI